MSVSTLTCPSNGGRGDRRIVAYRSAQAFYATRPIPGPVGGRAAPRHAVDGRSRPVKLRDQSISALEQWLDRQGLVGS